VYALVGDDELVLVDGGWALAASRRALEAALADLGRQVGDIDRFLVTHVHRDHYTQAIALRHELGIRVGLGVGERASLELLHEPGTLALDGQLRRLRRAGADDLHRRVAARPREVDLTNWAAPDDWIADHAELPAGGRALRAIRTPGHTQGHLVFADVGGGVLFAGDHVLPHITPSIGLEPVAAPLALDDYLTSLAAVRALPDLRLLPAHGPVTGSTHTRVDELVAHHEDRLDEAQAAVVAGASSGLDVARSLRWTSRRRGFDALDLFNRTLAVSETLAHLDLLVARGRLSRRPTEGPDRFELAM
jgi:glyoxylase-like metal-dependent hydrolase (beta-lactamase superfamily II)